MSRGLGDVYKRQLLHGTEADGKILNKSSKLPASIEKIIEKITIREFICVGGSLNLPVYNQIYHALQKN